MGVKESVLMRRVAWMQSRPLGIAAPSKSDKTMVDNAIKMLSAIALLNSFFYDLENEFEDYGLMKHGLKKWIYKEHDVVKAVHELAYSIMNDHNAWAGRAYNDRLTNGENEISTNVLLAPPERSYNIVLSLCRLVKKYNEAVRGWYDFAPAEHLYEIPRKIYSDKVKDYNIDIIVEKSLL